jgi:hypothetical protein
MYSKTTNPGAWVCSNESNRQNRGRLKIHQPGSKIYFRDGDEFLIELHNPTTSNVKAEIKIDGKPICSGGLVLRNGERIYLECFPDSKKKFTFKTYIVDDSEESKEAISTNGRVEIEFYKETILQTYCNPHPWNVRTYNSDITGGNNFYNCNTLGQSSGSGEVTLDGMIGATTTNVSNTTFTSTNFGGDIPNLKSSKMSGNKRSKKSIDNVLRGNIETGQIDGGEQSNQEFTTVDMTFDSYSFKTYTFQILPLSQKPVSKKEFRIKKVKVKATSVKLDELLKLKDLLEQDLISRDEFDKLKLELI